MGRTNQRTSLSLRISKKMEILFHVGINKVPCPNRSCGQGKVTLGREGHLFPPCPLFQCWRKSFSPAFLDIDGTFLIPLETPPKHCHNIEKRGCGGQGLKEKRCMCSSALCTRSIQWYFIYPDVEPFLDLVFCLYALPVG